MKGGRIKEKEKMEERRGRKRKKRWKREEGEREIEKKEEICEGREKDRKKVRTEKEWERQEEKDIKRQDQFLKGTWKFSVVGFVNFSLLLAAGFCSSLPFSIFVSHFFFLSLHLLFLTSVSMFLNRFQQERKDRRKAKGTFTRWFFHLIWTYFSHHRISLFPFLTIFSLSFPHNLLSFLSSQSSLFYPHILLFPSAQRFSFSFCCCIL